MMKLFIVGSIFIAALVSPVLASGKTFAEKPAIVPGYGKTPLYFIPNQGQVDRQVRYHVSIPNFGLWLTDRGMVFDTGSIGGRDVSLLVFIGASADPSVEPVEQTLHRVNFFRGSDKSKWRSNIPTSRAIRYKNLYPGIQLKIYSKEQQLEYDWIVEPGADPAIIKWKYSGTQSSCIDGNGDIRIKVGKGYLVHKAPVSFQVIDGRKRAVKSAFKKFADDTFGFTVDSYDKNVRLIIDPVVLAYSTYLGGSDGASATSIVVDGSGCAYVTGNTTAPDFPLVNPLPDSQHKGGIDGFICKFSADGSQLLYSTYLGGSGYDYFVDIAVDSAGSAYVTGNTFSTDFPVKNAFQAAPSDDYNYNGECFLARLSPDGGHLIYSTYLGGTEWDDAAGLVVDESGSAIVAGYTYSQDFPLKNPMKESINKYNRDGFITKFSPMGDRLMFSTFFGGDSSDIIADIALCAGDFLYITGDTSSHNFPLVNPLQGFSGYQDCFVSKLTSDGNELVFSTYLGGSGVEYSCGITADDEGYFYVTGSTDSINFPLENAFQDRLKSDGPIVENDCFVTKYAPDGSGMIYSTYLGGSGWDFPQSIAVDFGGSAVVAGHSASHDFPVMHALKAAPGNIYEDAFITRFSSHGKSLDYSTLMGGGNYEQCLGVALDSLGNIYMAGHTASPDYPVLNAFQGEKPALYNHSAFVTKIYNSLLHLIATRREERGWLIRAEFVDIVLWVQNWADLPIDRFVLSRKISNGEFKEIKTLNPSVTANGYSIDARDWQIVKGESYVYKVEALDADGHVILVSNEMTI